MSELMKNLLTMFIMIESGIACMFLFIALTYSGTNWHGFIFWMTYMALFFHASGLVRDLVEDATKEK